MKAISLICPTYRNPKCLDLFLWSAVKGRFLEKTEIIVVVDGFVEESQTIIDKYSKLSVKFCILSENRGMQYAINHGVYAAQNETILIVNDDNVLGDNWDVLCLKNYDPNTVTTINQVERQPGIFNFVVKDLGGPETFDYETWKAYEPTIRKDIDTEDGNIFPFMMAKRWFMMVNGFDTLYDSPNVCDLDFFLKLELAGLPMVRTHRVHFYHFGSVATKKNAEKNTFSERERKAFETFYNKWGFNVSYGVNNSKMPSIANIKGIQFFD